MRDWHTALLRDAVGLWCRFDGLGLTSSTGALAWIWYSCLVGGVGAYGALGSVEHEYDFGVGLHLSCAELF